MARIDIDLPDLSGKLALVTGASDGIGLVIASRLAEAGAEVIVPVRNPAKDAQAADRMRCSVRGAKISTHAMDLSSPESVAALAEHLLDEDRPINNAGEAATGPDSRGGRRRPRAARAAGSDPEHGRGPQDLG